MAALRPIFLAEMDKTRPVLILTRPKVLFTIDPLTVAVITGQFKNSGCEVQVNPTNGLKNVSWINCDTVQIIERRRLSRKIGELHPDQEDELTRAIIFAYGLKRS
jgi:mRNA interferase MazF